jgi:phosphate-selective porin
MTANRSPLAAAFVVACIGWGTPAAFAQATESSPAQNSVFEIAPRGYVQFDWRGYPDWPVTPGSGRLTHDTFQVRRARVGVDGRLGRIEYEVTFDPQDLDDTFVRDAYGRWRFTRSFELQLGQFKVPGSRDYLESARTFDFMERPALAQMASSGRDLGGMVLGDLGSVEYEAGVFAGDGRGRGSRAKLTSAGRVVWDAFPDVEVAGHASVGRTDAVDDQAANGLDGRTSSGYRFFERVYVNGRRVRFGADVEWSPGPWRFTGEALRVEDGRDGQGLDLEDLPSVATIGWSVSAVRQFGRRAQGQPRARLREFDLGIRVDGLGFDDTGADTGRDSTRLRATDVRARAARSATVTASWQPTRWSRILVNAGVDTFSDARSAPEAGKDGAYWTAGTRFQLELP